MKNDLTIRVRNKNNEVVASFTIPIDTADGKNDYQIAREYIEGLTLEKIMTC